MAALEERRISVLGHSPWYRTAPVPVSDQPWFVNGVALVGTELDPSALLKALLDVEVFFGRVRNKANAARVLDLDLLDYRGKISNEGASPALPHPRMQQRKFVLCPLADLAADWRHPITHKTAADLLEALKPGQETERMEDAGGRFGTEWKG